MVPGPADIRSVGRRYQMAVELMQELEIAFVNPIEILDPVADYAEPPDDHWSNEGHRKIGELLSDCVRRLLNGGDLVECAHVTLP